MCLNPLCCSGVVLSSPPCSQQADHISEETGGGRYTHNMSCVPAPSPIQLSATYKVLWTNPHTFDTLTIRSCPLALLNLLDSSESVSRPLVMGYWSISKVSVFRQKIRFSGLVLRLLKKRTMNVPWSRAFRICEMSAPPPSPGRVDILPGGTDINFARF